MTTFGKEFQLSGINGTNGFRIDGEIPGGSVGQSVASAGDVNGDGIDDIVVGAPFASPNGSQSGASYVVFGRVGGFGADLDLSLLNGSDGFQLSGTGAVSRSGTSVASAGDINGDGFDDLIVGAPFADANGSNSGASYLVFGRATGFGPELQLAALNGTNGFRLTGATGSLVGVSAASAGDFNGDGFDDLIIGASRANGSAGGAYVVYGRAYGFATNFDLSALDSALTGTNGFHIRGEAAGDLTGFSVSAAGDVNGDGFGDLIIGAGSEDGGENTLACYVVFGRSGHIASRLDLSTLNGTNGFRINREFAGDDFADSVSTAGDFNGDGFDDLIIGAPGADPNGSASGSSYLVFGRAGGFLPNLNVFALDGTNGFRIDGELTGNQLGNSVASAGDINGDGFDDLIIGAEQAAPNGGLSGASYVLLGRAGGFSPKLALNALDGATGFQISGDAAGDHSGVSVASAGDVNGDGFDDILIGAPGVGDNGAAYVIFGKATRGSAGNDVLDASDANDALAGLGGNDILRGNGGADSLSGGDGNDQLLGGAAADTLAGGAGGDLLAGGAGSDQLFGGAGNDTYALGSEASGTDGVVDADGIDTIASTINRSLAFAAFSEIENLVLSVGIAGTGNALANTITGNVAANVLDGGAGNDRLSGSGGNDVLIGNAGKDTMTGGTGNDVFRFAAAAHSAVGANADVVTDFDAGFMGDDRIDLAAVFGPAMTYRHNAAFTAAGQVRINDVAGADLIVEVNTGGSLAADMQIRLTNTTLAAMSASDFVL